MQKLSTPPFYNVHFFYFLVPRGRGLEFGNLLLTFPSLICSGIWLLFGEALHGLKWTVCVSGLFRIQVISYQINRWHLEKKKKEKLILHSVLSSHMIIVNPTPASILLVGSTALLCCYFGIPDRCVLAEQILLSPVSKSPQREFFIFDLANDVCKRLARF